MNAFPLVGRPRIPIPQPDFVDGPRQYDLSIVCGPHRLHNSADTEGICGKKRPEMPRKIRDAYTMTFKVFTSCFSYVLYCSTPSLNRSGLKIRRPSGLGGSTPPPGTTIPQHYPKQIRSSIHCHAMGIDQPYEDFSLLRIRYRIQMFPETIRRPKSYPPGMLTRLTLLLSVLLVVGGVARSDDLALTGAKIYTSPTEPPIENGSILMRDGLILSVGPNSTIKIPHSATVIDCKGMVITAGFWNSHVHILPPELLHAQDTAAKELNQQLDTMFNRWGFTTVFDIASVLDNTLALRRRIEKGELRGPRILTVGEPVWTIEPVYVRDFLRENNVHIENTRTPEQAIALVRDHAAKGADGIKLFAGSDQGHGEVALLPLLIAKAAVDEAHRRHLPVFAHPSNVDGVRIAIDSGVDVLAHTLPQSPPWTSEFVQQLKRANLSLIPTLTLFDVEGRKQNVPEPELTNWIGQMVDQLRAYSQAGGDILFGTDIGYTNHYDTTLEFTLMSQAGMDYKQILASLTTNPARKFGDSMHRGLIAKNMKADLVVLAADPANDPTAFAKVRVTIRSGKVLYKQ